MHTASVGNRSSSVVSLNRGCSRVTPFWLDASATSICTDHVLPCETRLAVGDENTGGR